VKLGAPDWLKSKSVAEAPPQIMGNNIMTTTSQVEGRILRPSEIKPHERGGGARTTPPRDAGYRFHQYAQRHHRVCSRGSDPAAHPQLRGKRHGAGRRGHPELDGSQHRMTAHDTTWVPADVPHRFINASDTNRLRIFWTYASVDATRTIVATGDTRTIDSERV
jgi:putative monooxygenase